MQWEYCIPAIPATEMPWNGGGGNLYLKLDIIKKNHVIRVVFQDQAMYARTSFRGAKTCKIDKKKKQQQQQQQQQVGRVYFWSYWQILERT